MAGQGPLLRDPGPLRSGLYDEAYANMRSKADDQAAAEYNTALLNTTRVSLPDPVLPEKVLTSTTLPGIERKPVEGTPVFSSDEHFAKAQKEASALADTTPLGQFTPYRPGFKADSSLKAAPAPKEPEVLASVSNDFNTAFPGYKPPAAPAPAREETPSLLAAPSKAVPASYTPTQPQQEESSPFGRAMANIVHREGFKTQVYKDSLGNATVGIGHLVKPEDNLKVGDTITPEQARNFFHRDAGAAYTAARQQMSELNINDSNFLEALTAVNFQLGPGWTEDFGNSWSLIKDGRYNEAASQLKSSAWYKQTPERVRDFQNALMKLAQRNQAVTRR